MKYFLYDNEGNVKAISESKIIYDENILSSKGFNPTANELELIKQGYHIKVKNNKLEFEKPPQILEAEKKADFKDKVEKAKTIAELKEIIINNI